MAKPLVTFGEIMVRFAPPGHDRFCQSIPGSLRVGLAGAEANVAASYSILGGASKFVTALPQHTIAEAMLTNLRGLGINTQHVIRAPHGRLGLLFVEPGANQRPSQVIYDREQSAFSLTPTDNYAWPEILAGAGWFHLSGITPALSRLTFEASLEALRVARGMGVRISCDLNYRNKLWRWDSSLTPPALAQKAMRELLRYVDVLFANEEDFSVLGIHAQNTDIAHGQLEPLGYQDVAREVARQFPQATHIAVTLRESISATHNNWGAMLYDCSESRAHFAPLRNKKYQPYNITHIVDRVGAGDAFAAALIYAMTTPELSATPVAVAFATAASCLAHSIQGDFNYASREEIERLMNGDAAGRIVR